MIRQHITQIISMLIGIGLALLIIGILVLLNIRAASAQPVTSLDSFCSGATDFIAVWRPIVDGADITTEELLAAVAMLETAPTCLRTAAATIDYINTTYATSANLNEQDRQQALLQAFMARMYVSGYFDALTALNAQMEATL